MNSAFITLWRHIKSVFHKFFHILNYIFSVLAIPVKRHFLMYLVMGALWSICVWKQVQYEGEVWLHVQELTIDLYLLSILLCILPCKVSKVFKFFLYIITYLLAIFEVFLTKRFLMLYTPTTLRLWQETNTEETREFFSAYFFTGNALWQTLSYFLPILILHLFAIWISHKIKKHKPASKSVNVIPFWSNLLIVFCLVFCSLSWVGEKAKMVSFFNQPTSQTAETVRWQTFYTPFWRIIYSLRMLSLADKDLAILKTNMRKLGPVTSSHKCPQIVLVIGESYNKYHSQLYGYPHATTPHQMQMANKGSLIPINDVVSVWNLTSNIFKHSFSTHSIEQPGGWQDGVLFPALMRKAGYKVAFLTNQFPKMNRQSGIDFNGSFFLNDAETDSLCFDFRNSRMYRFDKVFISEYLRYQPDSCNFIIFHLYGQHQKYDYRFTDNDRFFNVDSTASHPGLKPWMRQMLADYDNATRYNDEVFYRICQYFNNQDAIILYMADHGEEIFDHSLMYGRTPADPLVPITAHYEFEVPMLFWFSPLFQENHPDVVSSVKKARNYPFMTDDLPHVILGLAGVTSSYYDPHRDLLSDSFNIHRKRMLKNRYDYDSLLHHTSFEKERQRLTHQFDSAFQFSEKDSWNHKKP